MYPTHVFPWTLAEDCPEAFLHEVLQRLVRSKCVPLDKRHEVLGELVFVFELQGLVEIVASKDSDTKPFFRIACCYVDIAAGQQKTDQSADIGCIVWIKTEIELVEADVVSMLGMKTGQHVIDQVSIDVLNYQREVFHRHGLRRDPRSQEPSVELYV